VFLNILVALDGSPSARRALTEAADLARAQNSKLTLITVAPPISHFMTLGGVSSDRMRGELERWAESVLREADASLPGDVPARRVQRTGHVGEEIVKELDRGRYDLVVLGSRGLGRARSNLLGSVTSYVHFHSRIPILSVPPEGAGA
jgi:nucleotide-binding universal stress UspA family protein